MEPPRVFAPWLRAWPRISSHLVGRVVIAVTQITSIAYLERGNDTHNVEEALVAVASCKMKSESAEHAPFGDFDHAAPVDCSSARSGVAAAGRHESRSPRLGRVLC